MTQIMLHLKAVAAGLIGLAILALAAAAIVTVLVVLSHFMWLWPWLGWFAIVLAVAWGLGLVILSEVNVI